MIAGEELAPVARQDAGGDFPEFFETEYPQLAKTMYVLTRDPHEADDLAQEALVRMYERWDRVRQLDSPTGYLYRTALNLHRSRLRQVSARARRILTLKAQANRDPIETVDDRDELGRLLAALPRRQLEAVVLIEWLGLDTREVAALTGISTAALRMRLSRAHRFLRQRRGGSDG